MDQTPTGYPEIVKHVSPDGRTVLELVPGYDPGDIHEMRTLYRPKVIHEGTVILNLADEAVETTFEWQPGSELKLTLSNGLAIFIDSSNRVFSTSHDGSFPHPIAELNSSVHKILNPNWAHDPSDFRRRRIGIKSLLIGIILAAGLTGLFVEAWQGRFYVRGRLIDPGSSITGWSLTCSDGRHVVMGLNNDGSLTFDRSISAEPLEAVDGKIGRFRNARSVVDIDGTDATIWFDGLDGQGLRCRGG